MPLMIRVLATCIAVLSSATVVFGAAPSPPNVIIVLTDDQGFGDVGIHGNTRIRTPHLDRFAREGVRFSRFYMSAVCAPSRAALLTGRYPYRTGVIHTSRGGALMYGDEVTLAERLRDAGYRTGIFGKWHLGDNYPLRPSEQGFEESLIHKSGGIGQGPDAPSSYFDPRLWRNNVAAPARGYCTDIFFSAAIDYIESKRDERFFVYLATNAPHTPLHVDKRYSEPYRRMGLDDTTARAYGMVENLDENFGRLMAALDRLGLRDNTLVFFLTDNGPQHARFTGGLRGRKGNSYEGGIRVPAFVQWPQRIRGERVLDAVAAHVDVLPTILDICGVATPSEPKVDGRSLLPVLTGEATATRGPERRLFLQVHRSLQPKRYQNIAVVTPRFKLVGYPDTFNDETFSAPQPVFALYDLVADEGESRDVAAQHPEMVRELRTAYDAWFDEMQAARGFEPGVIHLGTEREPTTHLSRYQDGLHQDATSHGWRVKVTRGGKYELTLLRGAHNEAGELVASWNGVVQRQPLAANVATAVFDFPSGEGVLDVWLEVAGRRVAYTGNNPEGDVLVRRH